MITEVPVLPESAPFSPAQRAWLNGFFAGLISRGAAPQPDAMSLAEATADVIEADESMPWHDPALSMDERLAMTEDKPKSRQLMAAMAQLDCGACGYVCQTYAEAIAAGEEKDLTKCAPGGRETSKKLKQLVMIPSDDVTVRGAVRTKPVAPASPKPQVAGPRHAVAARFLKNQPLNGRGSSKDTRHIVFDLHGTGLSYKAGDALGVIPENCPDMVDWLLEALDASGAEQVKSPEGETVTLRDAMLRHCAINVPSGEMLKLLADSATDPNDAAELKAFADEDGPGVPAGVEVVDLLKRFSSARPGVDAFVNALMPIRPRLYSISSSPKQHADEVHLTVGVVRYVNSHDRQCKGVCSTYLADRLRLGQKAKVFVQPSHGFAPPIDPNAAMIMVGPGTGIAPFRAFLQDRVASGARGKNWLFFGDQKREQDFLYREEFEKYLLDGTLTRLDVAFSRDQKDKVYVQTRMLEKAREIWAWLNDGAHFYVCGDAQRMAKDVDDALKTIVQDQGHMSAEEANACVQEMLKSKRYARDVY